MSTYGPSFIPVPLGTHLPHRAHAIRSVSKLVKQVSEVGHLLHEALGESLHLTQESIFQGNFRCSVRISSSAVEDEWLTVRVVLFSVHQ